MIRRITLKNFMSHVDTVIEPADGLTVLVGPNNCGKSAVVAALQVLCHSNNKDYFIRHGAKECSIVLETDDGHTIEWHRKKSLRYVIDGKEFDRLERGEVPPELHAVLRMPKVSSKPDDFDVHFGEQKSPVFLLDKSGANAAQFFASSSDAGKLVEMQTLHKRKRQEAERDQARLQGELASHALEMKALETVPDISARISGAERDHKEIERLAAELLAGLADREALVLREHEFQRCNAHASALSPLTTPPLLADTAPLLDLIASLAAGISIRGHEAERVRSLAVLDVPPELADADSLGALADALQLDSAAVSKARGGVAALNALTEAPAMGDFASLAQTLSDFSGTEQSKRKIGAELEHLLPLSTPPILQDTIPLLGTIRDLQQAQGSRDHLAKDAGALSRLASAPAIDRPDELARIVSELAQAQSIARRHDAARRCFEALSAEPEPADTGELSEFIVEFKGAEGASSTCKEDLETANANWEEAKAALLAWAETNSTCPTCGGEIDRARLLAQAQSGLEAHCHA